MTEWYAMTKNNIWCNYDITTIYHDMIEYEIQYDMIWLAW